MGRVYDRGKGVVEYIIYGSATLKELKELKVSAGEGCMYGWSGGWMGGWVDGHAALDLIAR